MFLLRMAVLPLLILAPLVSTNAEPLLSFSGQSNLEGQLFATPSDIPVMALFAIHWRPEGERRARIVETQKAFVEHDDNAVLIEFEDLGQFYHVDPVGLLITGNRLATIWSPILPDPDSVRHDDDTDGMVEIIVIIATALLWGTWIGRRIVNGLA